ncbi:MAG: GGDEF domain-containing protein [Rhodospirillaceae bacterium]
MLAEKLEPGPANYTLWYSYYIDCLPDLTRAINLIHKDKRPFSQSCCDELFQRFFSSDAETKAIREAGERTQTALDRLLEVLEAASADTGRYCETIGCLQDNLDRPMTIADLRAAISEIVVETRTISEDHRRLMQRLVDTGSELAVLRAKLHSARREMMTDGLTGIANRKGFEIALTEAIQAAIETEQPLSLLIVDIDHFKLFNDRHGHLVGDHVLRLVARALTNGVRTGDTVARFGGEEFTAILPKNTLSEAVVLADRLRITVAGSQIINRNKNENFGTITLSAGVTEFIPGESSDDLFARADAALYDAKRSGRNRVCSRAPGAGSVLEKVQ